MKAFKLIFTVGVALILAACAEKDNSTMAGDSPQPTEQKPAIEEADEPVAGEPAADEPVAEEPTTAEQILRQQEHLFLESILNTTLTPAQFDVWVDHLAGLTQAQRATLLQSYQNEMAQHVEEDDAMRAKVGKKILATLRKLSFQNYLVGEGCIVDCWKAPHDNVVGGVLGGPVVVSSLRAQNKAPQTKNPKTKELVAADESNNKDTEKTKAHKSPTIYPIGVRGKHSHQVR